MPTLSSVGERNWPLQIFAPISVDPVTGVITVPSTKYLKVNQKVTLRFGVLDPIELKVRAVFSETTCRLGPIDGPFSANSVPIAYDTGSMTVDEQERSPIQPSIIDRAVYEEAPTVALRTIGVDWLGRFYSTDNPFPVEVVNPSVNNNQNINEFNSISSVPNSTETDLVTYTVPPGKVGFLARVTFGGENIATYDLYKNADLIERFRTYFGGSLHGEMRFEVDLSTGLPLAAGDVLTVKVTHYRPYASDHEGRIELTIRDA